MATLTGDRVIPDSKLRDYLLNTAHPIGGPKADFFVARGFSTSDISAFERALQAHADQRDIVSERSDAFGTRRVVRCSLGTPDGADACIDVVWFQEAAASPHRLITAYPA